MFAVRNNRMCTKDCLCIDVCPTGATDTEDGKIDRAKCIGCGVCAISCPAAAISMAQEKDRIPQQQMNEEPFVNTLMELAASKTRQEVIVRQLVVKNHDTSLETLTKALEKSNCIMAQGVFAEAGFMVPQGKNTKNFLLSLLINPPKDFPVDIVKELLASFETRQQ